MAKILIIDDEHLTIEMLTQYLELSGHEAVGALSSNQGLDKILYEEPDVLLLDIMLPDMSGLDICRDLRNRPDTAELPIIMISAHAPPMTAEAEAAGANDYLMKPIAFPALQAALAKQGIV